jgi:type IV secretory pathway VirB6-like protein
MESIIVKDYLNFANEPDIKKAVKNETILFTDKIIKINRYGVSQERNIIITNWGIYNLKKKCKKYNFYLYKIIY